MPSFVPQPVKAELLPSSFRLTSRTAISFSPEDKGLANLIQREIAAFSGWNLPLKTGGSDGIVLKRVKDLTVLGSYRLRIDAKTVTIEAASGEGLLNGFQTLRQALPAEAAATRPVKGVVWEGPCLIVEDSPRFPWRGTMLDVARHFMPVSFVKRFIDLLALHKLNVFHWHLTEDQGWRIEIKKWPKLTEVGAWRKETIIGRPRENAVFDGIPHGGFYTQEEIREVVAYAAERHITVVPEIEMPGHAQAAIAAYPQFGCSPVPLEVMTTWGVSDNVYNVKEETFAFLFDVLEEVLQLFPSKFIHIGGDECPKTQWKADAHAQETMKKNGLKNEEELQSWFIRRIDKFLDERGRRLVGWDEILEGGLAEGATVMAWRSMNYGVEAAEHGSDVVMSPTSHCYLDYYQARNQEGEPIAIGGYLPLRTVYSFEPVSPKIPAAKAHHVLGGQGNLWTEYMKDDRKVEYMAFPRLCALAEVCWSPADKREWSGFRTRLAPHLQRLDQRKVNYRALDEEESTLLAKWESGKVSDKFRVETWDITNGLAGLTGSGKIVFQYVAGGNRLDIEWIEILKNGTVIQRVEQYGISGFFNRDNRYSVTIPAHVKGDKIELRASVKGDGGSDSSGDITWVVPSI